MTIKLEDFLAKIEVIRELKPQYKLGHIGGDGWCDCIGLIMGALQRCGCSWVQATKSGAIHGSNWAARYALDRLFPTLIGDVSELSVGDIVFKFKKPGESGYALPSRYRESKSCDVGVYLDYMHVGVVTGVTPLRITHCTAGGVKTDTTLGKWKAYGRLKVIANNVMEIPSVPEPVKPVVKPTATPATVRNGSRGSGVETAQSLLNEHGYHLEVDGKFGTKTENAVRAFQRSCGLTVDGIVGPKTWGALLA